MNLSHDQAVENLKEIEKTSRRSAQALGYANASPGFILWGVIWMAGYAGSDIILRDVADKHWINWLWFSLTVIGVTGSHLIGRGQHQGRNDQAARGVGLRWGASFAVLWVFTVATFLVLQPATPMATGAFVPLLVAAVYAIFGVWKGLRFLYAGIAVAALTLGGYFFLPEHFLLWMAVVGGGSLVLVGLWLRKV